MKLKNILFVGILVLIVVTSFLSGATFDSANPQLTYPGGASSAYLSRQGVDLFPSFSGADRCGAGQDFALQISPTGCEPKVIRSDLLEEQNVPVFCPIVATQINPAVEINAIDSMTFAGKYPPEVSGVAFHPAQAAVRSNTELLNYPIFDIVGYAVIVLKKQPNESAMVDVVEGNLTAHIKYDVENAFGVGQATYYLNLMEDDEWKSKYVETSFWEGKGFLRLSYADTEGATISVYRDRDYEVASLPLKTGDTSSSVYLPGLFCQAGLQVRLNKFVVPETHARLRIGDDVQDVFPNGKFLKNLCSVTSIYNSGLVKSVSVSCRTDDNKNGMFSLSLSPRMSFSFGPKTEIKVVGDNITIDKKVYDIVYAEALENSYEDEKLVVWLKNKGTSTGKISDGALKGIEEQIKKIKAMPDETKRTEAIKSAGFVKLSLGAASDEGITLNGYAGSIKNIDNGEITEEEWENMYLKTINEYKFLAGENGYPYITQKNKDGQDIGGTNTYSEQGLREAIELSISVGKEADKEILVRTLNKNYPTEENANFLKSIQNNYVLSNSGKATHSVYVNGKYYSISLLDIYEPTIKDYGVRILIGGEAHELMKGQIVPFVVNKEAKTISLKSLDETSATFTVTSKEQTSTSTIQLKTSQDVGGATVILDVIYLNKMAQVEVIPNIENAGTDANITFKIGIEKRAIDLSVDEIKKRIVEVNKTINEWEAKSESLGTVVEGLKGACLATGLYLSAKDVIFGNGAEVQARSYTMRGVDGNGGIIKYCADNIEKYPTTQECLEDTDVIKMINDGVEASEQVIEEQNVQLKEIREKSIIDGATKWYGEEFVNDTEFFNQYVAAVGGNYPGGLINQETSKLEAYTTEDLRALEYCRLLSQKAGVSQVIIDQCKKKEEGIIKKITDAKENDRINKNTNEELKGLGEGFFSYSYGDEDSLVGKYDGKVMNKNDVSGGMIDGGDDPFPVQFITYMNKKYLVVLDQTNGQEYRVRQAYEVESIGSGKVYVKKNVEKMPTATEVIQSKFSRFISSKEGDYKFPILKPQVRYFSTAPNKGKPALVPFPFQPYEGFYVAVRQKISALGATESYDSSGLPRSYYVCNAGSDGSMDFNPEVGMTGGDECVGFDPSGSIIPVTNAFGLSADNVRQLAMKASRALLDAEKNTRRNPGDPVTILGKEYYVGGNVANIPQTQCQDLHSPEDCALLFNVCDPVVCPPSRCNLGGTFQVSDVIQSGIVGSIFLCLPNFGSPSAGKVLIPLCLTGIKAGIDGLLSVLKSYKDCLQEKLDSGKTVGICDEVYSLYLCDFLWRQIAPLTDIIIPKLLQYFSGQFVRGGGEYMSVAAAWTNAEKSMDYFTDQYAVNSFKAFQTGSLGDVIGSQVCKNFVSAGVSADLGDILEPESPPQYYGNFQEIPFTTATVPPTSQYSVYYHIFAGKNDGASYRVYLKSPEGLSIYYDNPILMVASGYINAGESVDEKKDSTAPSGYQQLCIMVNGQEECGFKQVTSSFAVDYAKDMYMKEEGSRTDIKTEEECLSGSSSLYSLLNPNFQAGVQETLNPDISSRGIVRVCSTNNPGSNIDGNRWKLSGYCGDPQLKCWTDQNSIKDVIQSTKMEEQTLQELTRNALDALSKEGNYMSLAEFDEFIKKAKAITNKEGKATRKDLDFLVKEITPLLRDKTASPDEPLITTGKSIAFDWQKAELILLKARALNRITIINKNEADLDRTEVAATEKTTPATTEDILKGKVYYIEDKNSISFTIKGNTKTLKVLEISGNGDVTIGITGLEPIILKKETSSQFDMEGGNLYVTWENVVDSTATINVKFAPAAETLSDINSLPLSQIKFSDLKVGDVLSADGKLEIVEITSRNGRIVLSFKDKSSAWGLPDNYLSGSDYSYFHRPTSSEKTSATAAGGVATGGVYSFGTGADIKQISRGTKFVVEGVEIVVGDITEKTASGSNGGHAANTAFILIFPDGSFTDVLSTGTVTTSFKKSDNTMLSNIKIRDELFKVATSPKTTTTPTSEIPKEILSKITSVRIFYWDGKDDFFSYRWNSDKNLVETQIETRGFIGISYVTICDWGAPCNIDSDNSFYDEERTMHKQIMSQTSWANVLKVVQDYDSRVSENILSVNYY